MWKGPDLKQTESDVINVDSLLIDPIISQYCVIFLLYPVIHTVVLQNGSGLFAHYSNNAKTGRTNFKSGLESSSACSDAPL